MATNLHANFTGSELHRVYRQIFADATERLNDSTTYTNDDLYKKALQLDTSAEYYLSSASPTTWTFIAQTAPSVTANNNVLGIDRTITLLQTEEVTGGTVLDGSKIITVAYFRIVGLIISSLGTGQVRLYDMGPANGPPALPVLRSTVTIPTVDSGDLVRKVQALTPVAAPSAPNEIYNTERIYEARSYLNSTSPGDTMRLLQAALVTYFY